MRTSEGIAIEQGGTQVMVSWPSYYIEWKLQKQTGVNWAAVTGSHRTDTAEGYRLAAQ